MKEETKLPPLPWFYNPSNSWWADANGSQLDDNLDHEHMLELTRRVNLHDEMLAMLKSGGPPPSGERFGDLACMEPVREHKSRHASTMLTFEATRDAMRQALGVANAKEAAGAAS